MGKVRSKVSEAYRFKTPSYEGERPGSSFMGAMGKNSSVFYPLKPSGNLSFKEQSANTDQQHCKLQLKRIFLQCTHYSSLGKKILAQLEPRNSGCPLLPREDFSAQQRVKAWPKYSRELRYLSYEFRPKAIKYWLCSWRFRKKPGASAVPWDGRCSSPCLHIPWIFKHLS